MTILKKLKNEVFEDSFIKNIKSVMDTNNSNMMNSVRTTSKVATPEEIEQRALFLLSNHTGSSGLSVEELDQWARLHLDQSLTETDQSKEKFRQTQEIFKTEERFRQTQETFKLQIIKTEERFRQALEVARLQKIEIEKRLTSLDGSLAELQKRLTSFDRSLAELQIAQQRTIEIGKEVDEKHRQIRSLLGMVSRFE